MEFFPFRRTREEADAFMDRLRQGIAAAGYGFAAAEIAATGRTIGWRLAPEFWGGGYVTKAGRRWLDFAFEDLQAPEVALFAVRSNERSLAVMRRLGMRNDPSRDFDYPRMPDTHPHLRRHALHRLTREEWAQSRRM